MAVYSGQARQELQKTVLKLNDGQRNVFDAVVGKILRGGTASSIQAESGASIRNPNQPNPKALSTDV